MYMRRAIVEISPGKITLDVVRSRGTRALAEDSLDSSLEGAAWFEHALATLAGLVRECKAERLSALTIVHGAVGGWDGGGATVIQSFPKRLAARQAIEGGLLALDAASKFDRADAPSGTLIAATDGCKGPTSRQHVASFAMSDAAVTNIQALICDSGLTFAGVVPGETVASVHALNWAVEQTIAASGARHSTDSSALRTARAFVWLDTSSSCLCVARGGRVLLTRPIPIGLESLVDALSKPVRVEGSSIACVRFDRAGARLLLASTGVPTPESAIAEHPGMTGANLLPLLQPVLQRLAVEIKQSVRFGLEEHDREGLELELIGPGATVPRLREFLSGLAGFDDASSERAERRTTDVQPREVTILGSHALKPLAASIRSRMTTIRACAAVGCAAAVCWVGFNWWIDRETIRMTERELVSYSATAQTARRTIESTELALRTRASLTAFESRIAASLGARTDWASVLRWLSEHRGESVRFASIECESTEMVPVVRLDGIATGADGPSANKALTDFLATLREWPPADRVHLRSTVQSSDSGTSTCAFEIAVTLFSLPPAKVADESRLADEQRRLSNALPLGADR